MKRGDLDRPTGTHLHLASAPSVLGAGKPAIERVPDTTMGRSDQNAHVLTGAQADTHLTSRDCGAPGLSTPRDRSPGRAPSPTHGSRRHRAPAGCRTEPRISHSRP